MIKIDFLSGFFLWLSLYINILLNIKNGQARRRGPQPVGHVLKDETSSNNLFLQSSSHAVTRECVAINHRPAQSYGSRVYPFRYIH